MRNKTVLQALAALVLIGCVGIGATLAILTDKVEVNVKYAYGTVNITLDEPKWASQVGLFTENDEAILYPGRVFQKNPEVTTETTSEPCYIRLKVVIGSDLAKVIEVPEPAAGWQRQIASSPNTYDYVYKDVVQPGVTTPPAFTEIKVYSTIPGETDHTKHGDYLAAANGQSIDVTAEAIQAFTFGGVEQAFIAYDKGDGI